MLDHKRAVSPMWNWSTSFMYMTKEVYMYMPVEEQNTFAPQQITFNLGFFFWSNMNTEDSKMYLDIRHWPG